MFLETCIRFFICRRNGERGETISRKRLAAVWENRKKCYKLTADTFSLPTLCVPGMSWFIVWGNWFNWVDICWVVLVMAPFEVLTPILFHFFPRMVKSCNNQSSSVFKSVLVYRFDGKRSFLLTHIHLMSSV